MEQKTTVLIVGAGPTGLMMAAQLTLHDIPFLIVDTKPGPTTQSRALGIQARTLEIFAQMKIVDKFLEQGQPAKGLNFVVRGKLVQHVPLKHMGEGQTQFPYMLMLEQAKTERIFVDFLTEHKKKIYWNTEAVRFTQDEASVNAVLKTQDGKEQLVQADYIIGADGAHSIVRHTLGIPLAGKTYKQSLFVLDCKIDWEMPRDELVVAFSNYGFAAFFPMTDNRWRIVGEVPPAAYGKDAITFEEVNKDFAKLLDIQLTLHDPKWISLYHSHHRCVETFEKGRAFLLGDAAHIHSPVGAQGMNTGLQDAYNLAWKLAYVIKGRATQSLLQTYTEERLPFARRLVHTTDRMFSLIVTGNPVAIFIRMRIFPRFIKFVMSRMKSRKFMFRTISQIGISYREESLSLDASVGEFSDQMPGPGDRLPFVPFHDEKNKITSLQDLVAATKFVLFVFRKKTNADLDALAKKHEAVITVHEFIEGAQTEALFKTFGMEKGGYLLVRPDMYIAYRCNTDSTEQFKKYLEILFI